MDGVKVKTIDTTGAGDAFVAGLLTQLVGDGGCLYEVRTQFSFSRFIKLQISLEEKVKF